jgi:hypothetical protein
VKHPHATTTPDKPVQFRCEWWRRSPARIAPAALRGAGGLEREQLRWPGRAARLGWPGPRRALSRGLRGPWLWRSPQRRVAAGALSCRSVNAYPRAEWAVATESTGPEGNTSTSTRAHGGSGSTITVPEDTASPAATARRSGRRLSCASATRRQLPGGGSQPPAVPEQPVAVVPREALRLLMAGRAGKGIEDRRDLAILMLRLDTGARREDWRGCTSPDIARSRAGVLGEVLTGSRHALRSGAEAHLAGGSPGRLLARMATQHWPGRGSSRTST